MFDQRLRGTKERLLTGAATRLGRGISPNQMTFVAFGTGLLAALLVWNQLYLPAAVLWLVNRVLDGLDGTLARVQGRQSDFGAYLDILLDFSVYAAIPLALVMSDPSTIRFASLSLLLALYYVNAVGWLYLAALLEKEARGATTRGELTSITLPAGLIGGVETTIFYILFLLFPAMMVPLFLLMAALLGVTILQRLNWAYVMLD